MKFSPSTYLGQVNATKNVPGKNIEVDFFWKWFDGEKQDPLGKGLADAWQDGGVNHFQKISTPSDIFFRFF